MKAIKRIGMTVVLAMGLVGCTSEGNQYSPEQVVQNALKETTEMGAYYAEYEMTISEMGQEIERAFTKEWRSDDGKIRLETGNEDGSDKMIAVNDGKSYTMYQVDQKQAFSFESAEGELLNVPSQMQQAEQLLTLIGDTHTISIEGEEKVAGRATYHLVAKATEKSTVLGDQELWVDKENWMLLKSVSNTGDIIIEMTYVNIDFNREIPTETFTVELPDDVEVQIGDGMANLTEVTLEEAAENIEMPFFYFPEAEGITIDKIEMTELGGELQRIEVNLEYTKDDLPLLTLTVFRSPEDDEGKDDLTIPGETSVMLRGLEGSKLEMNDFRTLFWQEGGFNYSIVLIDPNLTFDELIDMAEEMELVE